jgi:hypothetical protein
MRNDRGAKRAVPLRGGRAGGAEHNRLRAFQEAFADRLELPTSASVLDEPVTVVAVAYDGNPRRGLTARCLTRRGREHVIALADVCFPEGGEAALLVTTYRAWLGLDSAAPGAPNPASHARSTPVGPDDDIDLLGPAELVVLSVKERAARCRILGTDGTISLRSNGLWKVVPGEIVTVRPSKHWRYAGHRYLSGAIEAMRLDVGALGLVPLRLQPCGMWKPAEEYWGEEDDPIDDWVQAIRAHGPRPEFEMEQALPGVDPNDPDDPIIESNDLKAAGDLANARRMLMTLLEADLRCLDAHAHLGNLVFDHTPAEAIRHYDVGVRIGQLSLGVDFNGVLSWGLVDNRPFLRCMQGYGLCLWRLGRGDEAAHVFNRMLWMNPSDNQGIRFLVLAVREGRRWEESHF